MKKRKGTKLILIVILMIISSIANPLLISKVYANMNYTQNLKRGTQILEVRKYDEETWINTVNITSTPSEWFGGEKTRPPQHRRRRNAASPTTPAANRSTLEGSGIGAFALPTQYCGYI